MSSRDHRFSATELFFSSVYRQALEHYEDLADAGNLQDWIFAWASHNGIVDTIPRCWLNAQNGSKCQSTASRHISVIASLPVVLRIEGSDDNTMLAEWDAPLLLRPIGKGYTPLHIPSWLVCTLRLPISPHASAGPEALARFHIMIYRAQGPCRILSDRL